MVLSKGGLTKKDLDRMSLFEKRKYLDYLVDIFRAMNDPDYKKYSDNSVKVLENDEELNEG
ncbi:MAG: hypothetical protein KatS3mg068_1498 [Candidatus Sericytochromatia bacterium]|nr:MAG: hypothetical protein KatS3mg068_1498 [Candidatus Sericytochromatia bacterium]